MIFKRIFLGLVGAALLAGAAEAQSLGATPVTPSQFAAALNVAAFPGATVDAKIAACITALPSTGGTCDARSVPSGGTLNAFTITRGGVTILGPCGVFSVTGSITFSGVYSDTWRGCNLHADGNLGTAFVWAGNSTDPMFRLIGSRQMELANFSVKSSTTTPLATAFQQETNLTTTSTDNYYHDLFINGTNGGLGKGIRVCTGTDCGGSGGDANNDVGRVIRVSVTNYSIAAFSLEHTQAKAWQFEHSNCNGGTTGLYCITTDLGPSNFGGSFNAISMAGSANSVADFYLGGANDPINIIGGNFEGSGRLLVTDGGSSASWPITVTGVRWSASAINADNHAVYYSHRGGFNFIGNQISSPLAGRTPLVYLDPTGNNIVATAIGNTVQWTGTTTATSQPFVSSTPGVWRLIGNRITGSSSFAIPDELGGLLNPTKIGLLADAGSMTGRTLTYSGSCAATTVKGGIMAGSFVASGACAGGTYILTTSLANIPNGLSCVAKDLTTPANLINPTAYTTTSVTFTGTTNNSDLVTYSCTAF